MVIVTNEMIMMSKMSTDEITEAFTLVQNRFFSGQHFDSGVTESCFWSHLKAFKTLYKCAKFVGTNLKDLKIAQMVGFLGNQLKLTNLSRLFEALI